MKALRDFNYADGIVTKALHSSIVAKNILSTLFYFVPNSRIVSETTRVKKAMVRNVTRTGGN